SLKTSIKTITYLSDIGCLEIQGASLPPWRQETALYRQGSWFILQRFCDCRYHNRALLYRQRFTVISNNSDNVRQLTASPGSLFLRQRYYWR
ncbi:hypothetical protein NP068_23900, partial [Salmonella enterica]|nr:hypothetical protein [Salmonella enterica]